MLRVGHVRRSLGVGANGKKGDEGGVDDGGEERVEDVADVHDSLTEKQEEGEDGDDDIEVGNKLTPWERCGDGSIICVGIDDHIGIAVPAVVGTFLPKTCAVEIWLCDAKEGKSGDFDGELDGKEVENGSRGSPFPWNGIVEVFQTHDGRRSSAGRSDNPFLSRTM